MPNIIKYFNKAPRINKLSYIAPGSYIIGDVSIGELSGVWFNCIVRGDVESITIGNRTNIQDGSVIHVTRNGGPTIIGSEVTIGHRVMLHACTIQDLAFIGMGATLLDKVVVETHAMVAAGSLVPPGKIIKTGEIWAGNPAKFFRQLTQQEIDFIKISANNYVKHVEEYHSSNVTVIS